MVLRTALTFVAHRAWLAVLCGGASLGWPTAAAERVLVEWSFDQNDDLQGWRPNGQLADVAVTNGILHARAVGSDPILELTPQLDLPAAASQFIEVRLKTDRDGVAEWFWSGTTEGQYGGFSQEKTTRFAVAGDGHWHTRRLYPFWQAERRIVRLRFDLFDGAAFDLDHIRIGELERTMPVARADFVFTNQTCGWQGVNGVTLQPGSEGLRFSDGDADGFALAPPLNLEAQRENFLSLQLTVDRGHYATLVFATSQDPGMHRLTFPLEPGISDFVYNLDLLASREWHGEIVALGLQPSDLPGAQARLGWLKIGAKPQGPPRLQFKAFVTDDALLRAGRPVRCTALVANIGAETATNVQVSLDLPSGVSFAEPSAAVQSPGRLGFDEEISFTWHLQAAAPTTGTVTLRLTADNTPSIQAARSLLFTQPLRLPKADSVPAPKPVRGPCEVGVYYFPGWKTWGQWQPIQTFPERRPVLGWYREGDPEVADWHIKWAVEHGITFFAYDWYWSQGARQLEHGLHDGYFQARYRHLLKFCLLWANHNPPGTSSHADCLAVTRWWIDHYFRRPEHLTFDGKPVVIIFSPHRLTEDLGSAAVKQAFEAMREECRQAGLKGLYLLACVADAGGARAAAAEGYDAVTAYTWPGLGKTGEGNFAPFETLLDGYRRNWAHIVEQCPIPLLLPVCGGWDSRPWHGANNLVRYGRTPELFRRHLEDAKTFLETAAPPSPVRQCVLIEAWNEWGEGAYIEPHQEFGFGYLDAIRDVFGGSGRAPAAAHVDLMPADVGLGPYELAPEPLDRTNWDFTESDEGWGAGMNLSDLGIRAGALSARTGGTDPAFFGPPMRVRASRFGSVLIRLRLSAAEGGPFHDRAQLFWRTSRIPEGEATSCRFEVTADGEWHDYRLPVAENPRWRGLITRLRLDPVNRSQVQVDVDSIRLAP